MTFVPPVPTTANKMVQPNVLIALLPKAFILTYSEIMFAVVGTGGTDVKSTFLKNFAD